MEPRRRKGRLRSVVKTVVAVQRFAGSEEGVGGRRRAEQQQVSAAARAAGRDASPYELVGARVMAACSAGDVAALRLAVRQAPRTVDFEDGAGRSPLSVAAALGHDEVCRSLLDLGATLERPNTKDGMTPLAMCSWSGSERGVRSLAALGADLSTPVRINGELVPPVALCPDNHLVAVFEELNHGSAQPVLIRQRSFRRAATVVIAAERFRRGGGSEFGKLARIDECAVEDSRSSLDWDERTRRKMQDAADAAAADAAAAAERAAAAADVHAVDVAPVESEQGRAEESARRRARRRRQKGCCCASRPPREGG